MRPTVSRPVEQLEILRKEPPAIVGMSGQIHVDFLRLLWVFADKQMQSYYESMGKEDKIGNEAFR